MIRLKQFSKRAWLLAIVSALLSPLSASALPYRADAWNYGDCDSQIWVYVENNKWYWFSRADDLPYGIKRGWNYGGITKPLGYNVIIVPLGRSLNPKRLSERCMFK